MSGIVFDFLGALILPWLLVGVIAKIKAKWAGRKGAPVLQPIYDAAKQIRKGRVVSTTSTALFGIAPIVSLSAVLFAALLVPGPTGFAVVSFAADIILFAYLLALSRFAAIVAALDTGSSFEGMGASREAFFSTLAEPGLFLVLASLLFVTHSDSLSHISIAGRGSFPFSYAIMILGVLGLFLMILVEGHRLPVDDPSTHLELTMVHEVMVLDNSGPDLALITYTSGLKIYLFSAIVAELLIPVGTPLAAHAALFLLVVALIAAAIGLLESWSARMRLSHVPQFIFLVNVSGMLLFFVSLLGGQG
ncbi:MAG TPA: NADH-quinone oxidoreductase subunit H [Spirochaetia bacterium]|nr:NADH-quinone oxidoreductase subunit H [Spirochaetia bacterium]